MFLCVIKITVLSVIFFMLESSAVSVGSSSAEVDSSSKRIGASKSNARAIEIR